MSIIDELVTLLGFKLAPGAKGEAESYQATVNGITKAAGWMGAALVAATGVVQKFAMDQAAAIEEGGRFADSIGISYQNLQKLEYATTVTGGSVQELRNDLLHLTKTMNSPIPGEYNQTLYMLGISARDASGHVRKADDLLLAIGDKLSKMSKQRQLQFADRVGISAGTLLMLKQGRAEIARLTKEAELLGIVMSDDAKNKATVFEKAYRRTTAIVKGLGRAIAVGLLPGLTDAANGLSDWVVQNNKFISSGIQQVVEGVADGFKIVGTAIGWAYDWFVKLLGPLGENFGKLDAVRAIAVLVAGALTAMAVSAAIAAAPFLAIAAAVAAVVLVVEDLYVALKGGDSVLGGWAKSFASAYPNIARVLTALGKLVGGLAKALSSLFTDVILGALGKFNDLLGGAADLINQIFKAFDNFLGSSGNVDLAGALGSISTTGPKDNAPASLLRQPGGAGLNIENLNIDGAGDPSAVADTVVGKLGGLGLQSTNPGTFGPVMG